jgi:excisionase family DNA binding protein
VLDKKFFTAKELAESLQVTPMTIYRLAKRGELRAVRIGRSIRFSSEDVEDFIKNSSMDADDNKPKKKKRISLEGIISGSTVTDADFEEAKRIWTPKSL